MYFCYNGASKQYILNNDVENDTFDVNKIKFDKQTLNYNYLTTDGT